MKPGNKETRNERGQEPERLEKGRPARVISGGESACTKKNIRKSIPRIKKTPRKITREEGGGLTSFEGAKVIP